MNEKFLTFLENLSTPDNIKLINTIEAAYCMIESFDYSQYHNPKNFTFWKDVAYVKEKGKDSKKYKIHSLDMPDDVVYLCPIDEDIPFDIPSDDKRFKKLEIAYAGQIMSGKKQENNNLKDFFAYSEYDHPLTEDNLYLGKKVSD